MVRDTLIVGLADDDIRLDVLGQANQEMSLDETISGKRSAGRLHHNPATLPTAINAASSTYKRNERRRFQDRLHDRRMTPNCIHAVTAARQGMVVEDKNA